jgi:hypothetical protein
MAVTFEMVREIALSLDGVQEGTSYGTPAFKVGGVLLARLREDLDSLVLRTTFEQREELMAADPEIYYITDHYLEYPWVLVRLSQVHPDAMRDLIRMAWRLAGSEKRKASGRRRAQKKKAATD